MPPSKKQTVGNKILTWIIHGRADAYLDRINDAVQARRRAMSAELIATLTKGDKVRFNRRAKPKYLQGLKGVVEDIDGDIVVVDVGTPIGKYGRKIGSPGTILERVA